MTHSYAQAGEVLLDSVDPPIAWPPERAWYVLYDQHPHARGAVRVAIAGPFLWNSVQHFVLHTATEDMPYAHLVLCVGPGGTVPIHTRPIPLEPMQSLEIDGRIVLTFND